MMTEKDQLLSTMAREFPTTMKVLKAFPAAKGELKPHAKSKSARELAWNFVFEEKACDMALDGALELGKLPKPPTTLQEVISTYEQAHTALVERLKKTPEAELNKTVKFMTGPKQMGDMRPHMRRGGQGVTIQAQKPDRKRHGTSLSFPA